MRWHPRSLDAKMCGLHQSDRNTTLDVSARPQVGLPPLCGQATGYPPQGSRQLRIQQSIHRVKKGGEVPALMEACLQVHPLLRPLHLLQALIQWLCQMVLGISVHDMRWKISVWFSQRSRIRRSPYASVVSGGGALYRSVKPVVLGGLTFGLFTAQPVNMRGLLRT